MITRQERNDFAAALQKSVRGLQGKPIFGNFEYYQNYGNVKPVTPEPIQRRDFRGIFFKCLEMRATAVADAMSGAFVERETGQGEYRAVEYTHPWYQLIRNPSNIWTANDIWDWAQTSIDLHGNADFIVERGGNGMPVQLLPVFPEFGHVEIAPSPQGGVNHWLFYRSDGKIIPVLKENLVRVDRKSPFSPYETYSLIEAARYDLDTASNMKKYRRQSVENGGFSSPVLTTDQDLNDTQHKQLTSSYKEFVGSRGLEGQKVAVFGSGAKPWSPQTARDLEYIQGEVQTDKTIMIITGVPPGLFESTTTRATAEGAQVVFAQQTVSKLVNKIAQQLTHQFEIVFSADSGVLHIRPPDVIPLDKDFELRQRQMYLSTGQRRINDYLAEDGYQEDPNGNERYIPLGWTPISRNSAREPQPERAVRAQDKRAEMWREIDRKKRRQAEILKPVVKGWYEDVQKQVMDQVDSYEPKREFTQDVFDINQAEWDLMQRLAPEILRIMSSGFDGALSNLKISGLEFTINSPYVENTLRTILERQKSIPETLFDEVSKSIREGMEEKLSRKEMADKISGFFESFTEGKVENISNGLSTSTWEAGQDVAYNEAGVEQKEWLSSRDGRVRDTHLEADGQRVPLNGFFNVGGYEIKHPGDMMAPPEEAIGCRCTTLGVLD